MNNEQIDGWIDGQTDRWIDEQIYKQTDGRQTDTWMD